MARDWRRLSISLDSEHDRKISKMRKKLMPYAPESIGLREILLQLADHCSSQQQFAAICEACPSKIGHNPSGTDIAPKILREEKKKETKEEEKKGRSDVETRLAPLDVAKRIVSDLNEQTGSTSRANGKIVRGMIQARLNDGWTEADFYEVHRKKVKEWKGDPEMERYLVFGTLYKPSNFEKYLGQPDVGPKRRGGGPVPQSEKQDYTEGVNPDGTW